MWPVPSRFGYVLYPVGTPAYSSLGVRNRAVDTYLDTCFIAKYNGPIHEVAFWVRHVEGSPSRSLYYFRLYQDNGNPSSPGTVLEQVSGFSGPFPASGRVAFTGGFSHPLVKGRRYRLRLLTTATEGTGYPEILLRPFNFVTNNYNEDPGFGDYWQLRWESYPPSSDYWLSYNTYNTQIVQSVGGQPVVCEPLLGLQSGVWYADYGVTSDKTGVRVTMPGGADVRVIGVSLGYVYLGQVSRILVYDSENRLVGYTIPYRTQGYFHFGSPYFGHVIHQFYRPVLLRAGQTYDFLIDFPGLASDGSPLAQIRSAVISSVRPPWLERFKLLVGGTEIADRAVTTFMLILDDVQPSEQAAGIGIVDSYLHLPVG